MPPPDRDLTEQDLDRSVDIMRNRVDKLGVTEPEIRKQGSDQIVIQLPGVNDPQAAAEIIGKTAQLELYDLETSLTGPSVSIRGEPVEFASLYDLLARVQSQAAQGTASAYYVFNKNTKRLVDGPFDTKAARREGRADKRPNAREVLAVPDEMVVVTCGENAVVCPGGPQGSGVAPDRTYYYLFKYEPPDIPQMTGEDLKLDGTRADFDTSATGGGRPIVTMEFTGKGADKFEEITRDEWTRGRIRQAPQHFAIVLDREIRTFPQIDLHGQLARGRHRRRRAQIQGLESIGEAKDIAIVLQTGALPVNFETLASDDVSATLGKDSLRGGEARRDRRTDPRRDLPAHLLPLPRCRRGGRARHLRRIPVRSDPALQRHAHASRIRRPRPDVRRRRGRERRHLRTHQGRGACREIDTRRDLDRVQQGLPHDRGRERRHRDHCPRPVRGRDRQRPRVRAHAPDRNGALDADRRARDPRRS